MHKCRHRHIYKLITPFNWESLKFGGLFIWAGKRVLTAAQKEEWVLRNHVTCAKRSCLAELWLERVRKSSPAEEGLLLHRGVGEALHSMILDLPFPGQWWTIYLWMTPRKLKCIYHKLPVSWQASFRQDSNVQRLSFLDGGASRQHCCLIIHE